MLREINRPQTHRVTRTKVNTGLQAFLISLIWVFLSPLSSCLWPQNCQYPMLKDGFIPKMDLEEREEKKHTWGSLHRCILCPSLGQVWGVPQSRRGVFTARALLAFCKDDQFCQQLTPFTKDVISKKVMSRCWNLRDTSIQVFQFWSKTNTLV